MYVPFSYSWYLPAFCFSINMSIMVAAVWSASIGVVKQPLKKRQRLQKRKSREEKRQAKQHHKNPFKDCCFFDCLIDWINFCRIQIKRVIKVINNRLDKLLQDPNRESNQSNKQQKLLLQLVTMAPDPESHEHLNLSLRRHTSSREIGTKHDTTGTKHNTSPCGDET